MKTKIKRSTNVPQLLRNNNFRNNQNYAISGKRKIVINSDYVDTIIIENIVKGLLWSILLVTLLLMFWINIFTVYVSIISVLLVIFYSFIWLFLIIISRIYFWLNYDNKFFNFIFKFKYLLILHREKQIYIFNILKKYKYNSYDLIFK